MQPLNAISISSECYPSVPRDRQTVQSFPKSGTPQPQLKHTPSISLKNERGPESLGEESSLQTPIHGCSASRQHSPTCLVLYLRDFACGERPFQIPWHLTQWHASASNCSDSIRRLYTDILCTCNNRLFSYPSLKLKVCLTLKQFAKLPQ